MAPESTPPFSAQSEEADARVWVVRVSGELDIATAPRLQLVLDEAIASDPASVMLDLDGLDFLDSTGITVLVRARRRLEDQGARLVLDGISPAVERVLEVAGVLDSLRGP
jgi:anti-anti-sigma factor